MHRQRNGVFGRVVDVPPAGMLDAGSIVSSGLLIEPTVLSVQYVFVLLASAQIVF